MTNVNLNPLKLQTRWIARFQNFDLPECERRYLKKKLPKCTDFSALYLVNLASLDTFPAEDRIWCGIGEGKFLKGPESFNLLFVESASSTVLVSKKIEGYGYYNYIPLRRRYEKGFGSKYIPAYFKEASPEDLLNCTSV